MTSEPFFFLCKKKQNKTRNIKNIKIRTPYTKKKIVQKSHTQKYTTHKKYKHKKDRKAPNFKSVKGTHTHQKQAKNTHTNKITTFFFVFIFLAFLAFLVLLHFSFSFFYFRYLARMGGRGQGDLRRRRPDGVPRAHAHRLWVRPRRMAKGKKS